MKRSSAFLLAALLIVGGLAAYFAWNSLRLRQALDDQAAVGGPGPAPGRITTAGDAPAHSAAAVSGPRPPSWAPGRPPAPSAPIEPMKIQTRPDGTFVIRTPGGSELPALTAEETQELAQALQSALLEVFTKRPGGPSWSPGQSAGPPDTTDYGDRDTAWAPQTKDDGPEWLKVSFERAVEISEITIHESFNPGALTKVSALLADGSEKIIWQGTTPAEGESVERAIPVPPGIRSDQIRIDLDTSRVAGWNEIDAVELVGTDGSRQWAREATASSHFGQERAITQPRRGL